jgi:uncharacterized lipoprotein YmbA
MRRPIAILALSFVVGCSSLPTTHYYVLELDPVAGTNGASAAGAGETAPWTIGVRPFTVDAPYDQDRIVYRVGEGSAEVGFYAYHLWAAPLDAMIAAAVATGLEGTPAVSIVEPAAAGRSYRAWLHGRVLALEEVDLPDRQLVRA